MAESTRRACEGCVNEAANRPYRCCDKLACERTREWAFRYYGVVLENTGLVPDIPFMGEHGCTVPAYLRPDCAMHLCPEAKRPPEYIDLYNLIKSLEG